MTLSRRFVLAGLGMAALRPAPAFARSAARRFRIFRDGAEIGAHSIALTRDGEELRADIEIDIAVKLLGVTAYRYEMTNREVWRGGRLISLDSETNDDGETAFARARAEGDAIAIEGSGYTGRAPAEAATTSYFAHAFLRRPVWISTQSGTPLTVAAQKTGRRELKTDEGASFFADRWAISGDLETELYYAGEEWVSVAFDAGGERAIYRPEGLADNLAELWPE